MKRIFALLLILCLLGGLSLSVIAEEEPLPHIYMKYSLDDASDRLRVELYTDGKKWTAIDFGLTFDPSVLRLDAVTVGSKILTAIERKGFEFLTMHRDLELSNQSGFCNFVAAVGSETCNMTNYAGPVVVYDFTVIDATAPSVDLDICLATMVDKDGNALLEYTPYGPNDTPIPYETHTINFFTYGDLNGDGVNVFDAMMIMQYVVGTLELDEQQLIAARVSGNEEVSVFDAMMIMQYVVGTITSFPAEQ